MYYVLEKIETRWFAEIDCRARTKLLSYALQAASFLPSFFLSFLSSFKMATVAIPFSAKEITEMSYDDLFKNVEEGMITWGDIGWADSVMNPSLPAVEAEPEYVPYSQEEEMLENWSVPDLTLRKGIWENFPVTLIKLDDTDGTDRYAVMWHNKNYDEWRNTRSESLDEYMDYDDWCEWRLRYALKAYSHKYTVEESSDDKTILVIAMVHSSKAEAPVAKAAAVATAVAEADEFVEVVPKKFRNIPVLTRLNDIKNNFPVVWHETPNKSGSGMVYAIELFGKKIKELSAAAGHDLTEEISGRLMVALKASSSWTVLRAESPREFCRIRLA